MFRRCDPKVKAEVFDFLTSMALDQREGHQLLTHSSLQEAHSELLGWSSMSVYLVLRPNQHLDSVGRPLELEMALHESSRVGNMRETTLIRNFG